jgi:tRNA U34 5-methylaminomethyl-2-thiouridine-forming methyltransferase MnmC
MPASEIKRGRDACKAYVDKVCACAETVPAMKQQCALAHALPDAIQVGLDVAESSDSTRRDVLQVHDSVRKIVKQCIEDTARLPAAGCP